ncbi:hypothetical protein ILYODFUR_033631 [Ilyodon furcidens]|uniref:Uncharacterized protein n=1 Tax=Ilyodon furcidens TaxID=33524 RepID=A0ABV0UYM9_9TELE
MEDKIIVTVCGKPESYDSTDYFYTDTYRKDLAWRRVSEETGVAEDVPKKTEGFAGHVPEGEKEGAGEEEEWSSSRCGKKVQVLCRPFIPRPLCGSTAHHQQHGPGRGDGRGPTCSTPRRGYVGDRKGKH